MIVDLTLANRFHLLQILPTEGSFVTLKAVRRLREELAVQDSEIEELGIRQDGNRVEWNVESDGQGRRYDLGNQETDLIAGALQELDRTKRLKAEHLDLYELFVLGGPG